MATGSINLVAPEAEESLLALGLESPAALMSMVTLGLKPEDFGTPGHELIFRSMREMMDRGQAVDSATLISYLETTAKLDLVGGKGVIERLSSTSPVHGINEYADIIKDRSVRRSMFDSVEDIIKLVNTEHDIHSVVSGSQNLVYRVSDLLHRGAKSGLNAEDLVNIYLNRKEEADRIPYPFHKMNEEAKGRERGSLTVWGGASSDGKTIVGMQSALAAANAGYRVAIFSLEMTEEELMYRLLAMQTGIEKQKIEQGDLDMVEEGEIRKACHTIAQLPITTYHDPEYTPAEIRGEQMKERYDLIVIDYLQRFPFTDWKEIPAMARQFKNIALSTHCAIDVLSQINAAQVNPGQNPFPVPTLNSLYGGRATAHEANNVFFIYAERERSEDKKAWNRTGEGSIYVAKQRGGRGEYNFPVLFNQNKIMWEEQGHENVLQMPTTNTK